jgi:hypothetical protein
MWGSLDMNGSAGKRNKISKLFVLSYNSPFSTIVTKYSDRLLYKEKRLI